MYQNYLRNYNPPTVPGNSSYAAICKFGKKIFVVGDSRIKRIKRLDFNKELRSGKAFLRSFSGANSKQLDDYIIPTLVDDEPDVVLLHVGTNDILSNASDAELANNIINIELKCKNHGFSKVFISAILVKKNAKLNPVIRKLCETNGFLFINNDAITTNHPWRDDIHLQDIGTNILSRNFYKVLNNFLFEDHSLLKNLDQTNEFVFDSDLKGLSKFRKAYPNNPIISYLNINSLKEKLFV